MNLLTGHPADLKTAFLDFIKTVKNNPLDKVLIVLPSQRVAADLKDTLAKDLGCVSALYFEDFTRMANNINLHSSAPYKPLQKQSALQNFVIKNILEDYGVNASRGYAAALKAAFLDLSGAGASAQDLQNIANESDTLSEEQKQELRTLSSLFAKYCDAVENKKELTFAQMLVQAAQQAQGNAYLEDFKHIVFYGYYDMTGLQLDLFNAVCDNYQVTVFFPYEANPACNFAKKNYEAAILGRAKTVGKVAAQTTPIRTFCQNIFYAQAQETVKADIKIISVSGTAAEAQSAAKAVLMLKEEQGVDFKDIAITARTMEPYKDDILNILAQNKIPANCTLEQPLLKDNFAAFIFNLFNLARNNFYKDDVLAVITSPYFKGRDDAWPSIIKKTGISAGLQQWFDLLPLAQNEAAQNSLEAFLKHINKSAAQLGQGAPFADLCETAKNIIFTYSDEKEIKESEAQTLGVVLDALAQIESFAAVRQQAKAGEFLEEFNALIKEQTFNVTAAAPQGVVVADIMALRAQGFKAVIIMGLNEGLLPAQPAHDPVLKDDIRNLMQNLGYQLHKRADRYDEEKLLFYFALSCARQSATLIYQRSGEDGKPKIPSLYLTQVLRVMGQDLNKNDIFVLSRRPAESYQQWPAQYLNQSEAQLLACLNGGKNRTQLLADIFAQDGKTDAFTLQNITAANALTARGALTPYDGLSGPNNAAAQEVSARGISPSDLQNLYRCPAKYLFNKITLREDDTPFERGAISPLKKGVLYHKILESFYSHLRQNKLFDKLFESGAKNLLKEFTGKYLAKENYKDYGMYPIVWDMTAREMEEALCELVAWDSQNIQESGLYPAMFERRHEAEIELKNTKLKLRGTLDRVNISQDGKSYSITDYKTKKESAGMERAIFEKSVLQPPLYFEMAKTLPELEGAAPQSMSLLGIEAQGSPAKTLNYDEYLALRPRVYDMLAFITALLNEGIFIINPSEESCKNCRFEAACRKAHSATAARCKNTREAKTLREYHGT